MTTIVPARAAPEPLAARYAGVLNDEHWHAVVRIALGARDSTAATSGRCNAELLRPLGERLRDRLIVPRVTLTEDLLATRAWSRLPLTLALGWRQVEGAQAELDAVDEASGAFGATLHAAISIIDHVLDETPARSQLPDLVNEQLVKHFFRSAADAREALASTRARQDDPTLDLVLILLEVCAEQGWEAVSGGGRRDVWARLGDRCAELLTAELQASAGMAGSADMVHTSWTTSVGPSQVLALAASLAPGQRPVALERRVHRRMQLVGEVLWVVDDLVDLLLDDRRGHLNALLASEASPTLGDSDLYRIADTAAARLSMLVDSLGGGPLQEVAFDAISLWAGTTLAPIPGAPTWSLEDHVAAAVVRGVDVLLRSAAVGFSDATHQLRLPRVQNQRRETHPSVLLARTVAVDALLEAAAQGADVPAVVLDREVTAMLRDKHSEVRGGWNYLPSVSELPPDIDDLGQVLQVLFRHGGDALALTGLEGARLAVDQQEPDGGVGTWILDPRGVSPADELVRAYLPVMGGWGIHPEVVATFAAGLWTVDPLRWAGPLAGMASYLIDMQNMDGSWSSQWYDGPYYGTYRAVWLLTRLRPGHACLARAESFLRGCAVDGGWGEGGGDPLATALALLALLPLAGREDTLVRTGVERLLDAEDPPYGWAARPWVTFPTLDGLVSYGSQVITTAFAVKALCAAGSRP